MDYNPPLCTACHYRLPMTWTNKNEMYKMLTVAGWKLHPAICPECRRKKMARGKQMESICTNCGFWIVTDHVYPIACPICGEQMTQRKPTPQRRGNKEKSKGEK